MKTPNTTPLPDFQLRHAAAQDAGQFSAWFRQPAGNPPAPAADTVAFIVVMDRPAANSLFAKLRRAS